MRAHGLIHHTLVYTAGSVVYRAASFVLVPLYVRSLPAAEYGKLELIATTMMILGALLSSGLAHSIMRFYFEYTTPDNRKAVVSTGLFAGAGMTALGVSAAWVFAPDLSDAVLGSPEYATAFRLAATALVFELAREIALAYVRATQPVDSLRSHVPGAAGGHQIFNNILLSESSSGGSIAIGATSGLDSSKNAVVNRFSWNDESSIQSLAQWQSSGYESNSFVTTAGIVFANPSGNDYRARTGSPLIDKGLASFNGIAAPSAAREGTPRRRGAAFDIGAYEQ